MFILTHPVWPVLSTFPVGGNRSTRRKPTTFGRALTDSFHASPYTSPKRDLKPRSQKWKAAPQVTCKFFIYFLCHTPLVQISFGWRGQRVQMCLVLWLTLFSQSDNCQLTIQGLKFIFFSVSNRDTRGAFHLMARPKIWRKWISVKIDPNFQVRLARSPNVLCFIQQCDRSDRSRRVNGKRPGMESLVSTWESSIPLLDSGYRYHKYYTPSHPNKFL